MITIAGIPLDISTLSGQYTETGIEMQLLKKMHTSAETYHFSSLNALLFELRLRKEIVNAAIELHKSGMGFAGFADSRCNPEYWLRTGNGGFRLKEGANPAAAIRDIFSNGSAYATECATAMMIVYYRALLTVFQEERFNKLFPYIYLMGWDVMEPLLKEVKTLKRVADILIGDRGYFANPAFDPATPEWQGENVIVLSDALYYGHGICITSADKIIAALNVNRKSGADTSAYFMDAVGRPNFAALAEVYLQKAAEAAPLVWQPFPDAAPAA